MNSTETDDPNTVTQGNHTATQSTFGAPCVSAHFTNQSTNGFDSSFRDTHNGTAITQLSVPIQNNDTIWFFDWNTCGLGGVGGINLNTSADSTETLDGFQVSFFSVVTAGFEKLFVVS